MASHGSLVPWNAPRKPGTEDIKPLPFPRHRFTADEATRQRIPATKNAWEEESAAVQARYEAYMQRFNASQAYEDPMTVNMQYGPPRSTRITVTSEAKKPDTIAPTNGAPVANATAPGMTAGVSKAELWRQHHQALHAHTQEYGNIAQTTAPTPAAQHIEYSTPDDAARVVNFDFNKKLKDLIYSVEELTRVRFEERLDACSAKLEGLQSRGEFFDREWEMVDGEEVEEVEEEDYDVVDEEEAVESDEAELAEWIS